MDVQLYMFINGAWQEYNPKPAAHNHIIGEVTGLQAQLNSKLNLSGGTMIGPITMGSNNITGNNSSIFQAGRIIATNSNTSAHGITSKGTRANMLYLMDGATGGLAASLLDVDVKNTTTPQKRIAKIGILGSATSGTGGTPSANYLWLSAVEDNTYNKDATLKVDAQNRVGIAIAGSERPTQALDVDGKIRMRTVTVDSDGADTVVTKGYMLGKWNAKQDALGFTPENIANKRTSIRTSGADNTSYVSELGVKTYVDGLIGSVYRPAGDWNAATNSPALANNTPANAGKVYRVSVAGTRFGFTFAVGDKLAFNESGVISKWDNVDDVTSVNGQTGTVNLTTDNVPQGSNLYVSQGEKDKLEGIETGAQVNKIESISLDSEELLVSGKSVSIPTTPIYAWAMNANKPSYTAAEVGLGNVNNTSDLNKPISTATQTALNLKANDNQVVKLSGEQTISGEKTFNNGITIPGNNSYIDIGEKTNWFWTRFSGENWTFNNTYTGGGWARNLMEMKDAEGTAYFRIGAQGSSQSFTQMYIGPTYSNYWLSLNGTRALFKTKPQYAGNPTDDNDLTKKYYVDTKLATKQATLISGTNIKSFNNQTLLGSGEFTIATNKVLGRTTANSGAVEELDLIDIGEINLSNWTQVWSGSINLNSYRSSFYSATVPSNTYIGKRIAIEVQYGSGTTYTSKIIFGVLGSSSATGADPSVSKGIGWNYFDGTYLRVKTLFTYTSTSNTSAIYVGNLKTLFGKFTGTTIEWSTSYSETLYMKKIWVIE